MDLTKRHPPSNLPMVNGFTDLTLGELLEFCVNPQCTTESKQMKPSNTVASLIEEIKSE